MKIHEEGYVSILIGTIVLGGIGWIVLKFLGQFLILSVLLIAIAAIIWFLLVRFFRVPSREITQNSNEVICPADGKVVAIEEVLETEFFNEKRIQVSVFMSPLNVHVNFSPISGNVVYQKHHPGKYLVAWHPKSSTDNERTTVVVKNHQGVSVLFRQIAGALARRIVCNCKKGDVLEQGREFGIIKFGSRVDVLLPSNAEVLVGINQKVVGSVTRLAKLN